MYVAGPGIPSGWKCLSALRANGSLLIVAPVVGDPRMGRITSKSTIDPPLPQDRSSALLARGAVHITVYVIAGERGSTGGPPRLVVPCSRRSPGRDRIAKGAIAAVKRGQKLLHRIGILGELFRFLWKRRLWWIIPMILALVLLTGLLVFAEGSAIAPFIYSLF